EPDRAADLERDPSDPARMSGLSDAHALVRGLGRPGARGTHGTRRRRRRAGPPTPTALTGLSAPRAGCASTARAYDARHAGSTPNHPRAAWPRAQLPRLAAT